jgi:hypothetical protein
VDQRGYVRPDGACDIGAVERDLVAPVMNGKPTGSLAAGSSLVGAKPQLWLRWGASDDGSGVYYYRVEQSIDGGPWSTLQLPSTDAITVTLPAKGARYRVTPYDRDGNAGTPTVSRTLQAELVQQTYGGITYEKRWRTASSGSFSGGSVRHARAEGASARFLFTGRSIGFVTTTRPDRGKVRIFINGTRVETIDLGASEQYRYVGWQKTWSSSGTRTIKVVVVGTAGRPRVDVDAFVVLE